MRNGKRAGKRSRTRSATTAHVIDSDGHVRETDEQIIDQLGGLYLGEKTAKPGIPVSGFVFFPEGRYAGVRVVAVARPGGEVQDVFGPMVKPSTN